MIYGIKENKCLVPVTGLPQFVDVTLLASGWTQVLNAAFKYRQSVTVNGIKSDPKEQMISWNAYADYIASAYANGVACYSQGANVLTFVCDKLPTGDINIFVSITEVSEKDDN